jgi:hypothetical protein
MTKNILTAIGAASFSLFFHCVGWNDVAGNGTLIGNPTVAGVLYDSDGSFAENAAVHLRKKNFLPDVSRLGLTKRARDTASVVTGDSGRFAFDTAIDTGLYLIEAVKGTNAVLIDSIVIARKDKAIHLPPDTLKPMGTIKGVISLSEGGDTKKVFILAYGIDGFTRVDTDGTFSFPCLARGNYRLRVVSTLADYAALDTGIFTVVAAETTDVKTLRPPAAGNEIPKYGSTIRGALYASDGSPARGIAAFLREYSGLWDSLFSPIDFGIITETNVVAYCITNQSGTFMFDSLPIGTYAVEAASGTTTVLIDSLKIASAGLMIHPRQDTLKPAGTLTGVIRHLNAGGIQPDSTSIYVIVGSHWYTMAYDNLRFIFNGLAEGSYRVRVVSSLAAYPTLDAGVVTINPGDTTDIGLIELRLETAVPAP